MVRRRCCVPFCKTIQGDMPMHSFPNIGNPEYIENFRTWVMKIGGDIVGEKDTYIRKNRKVCHLHFEAHYVFPNKRITKNAIPTLHLPGLGHPKATVPNKLHKTTNVSVLDSSPVTSANSVQTDEVNGKFDHTYFRNAFHDDHSYVIKTFIWPDEAVPLRKEDHQQKTYSAKDRETTASTSNAKDGEDEAATEGCALGEPGPTEDDDFASTSPVPEIEAERAKTLFSWQTSELIPADDPDEAVTSELEDPSGVSLYCEDDAVPQPTVSPPAPEVPEPGVKEVEYHCKECGEAIDGFQFWCVQCLGCALCGACEARGAHTRHYVLRAPPGRPYRQTQVVLAAIRHQLQNDNMLTQHDTDDGVKLEVKDESPEEEVRVARAEPGPDPLAEAEPPAAGAALPRGRHHITVAEEIIDDHRPFKRPRLADFIEKDFAAAKSVRGIPLPVKVTSRPEPAAETILVDLDDMVEVEYLIEDELETDDEVIRNEDEEEDAIATRLQEETYNIVTRIVEADDTDPRIIEIEDEIDQIDTRIVEDDEMDIDTSRDENDGEMILSDCAQRGVSSKQSETEDLPVRGPPASMVKTLTSKPIVQLRPLSSVDIRKWTAHTKKRRK